MKRQRIQSGAPWEEIVGYSRAIKIGPIIEISGTTAVDGENIIGRNNPYLQTKFILEKIQQVLHKAGGSMSDVIRSRIFVTNIDDWEHIGRAHGEFFKDIKPAATMVEVSKLIHPDLLVEIEITAYVEQSDSE